MDWVSFKKLKSFRFCSCSQPVISVNILYGLHSEFTFVVKLLWLKVNKVVGAIFLEKVPSSSTWTGWTKCLLFSSRRALGGSARLSSSPPPLRPSSPPLLRSSSPPLLFSPGSAVLELGTWDVHCLSLPLRGEARCEGEISREETAERRGPVSPSPVLKSTLPVYIRTSTSFPFLSFPFSAGSTWFQLVASQPILDYILDTVIGIQWHLFRTCDMYLCPLTFEFSFPLFNQ